MRTAVFALTILLICGPLRVAAQDQQTLADIRQELTVLYVEVQRLKREMSTTGAPSVDVAGSSVLDRVSAMEEELQRLTAKTEELDNRVQRVVADGTNEENYTSTGRVLNKVVASVYAQLFRGKLYVNWNCGHDFELFPQFLSWRV